MATISTTVSGAISRIITKVEAEKDEGSNQQFKYERKMCSEMQWQSNKTKICYQQRIELQEAIDEPWDLTQVPRKRYNRAKLGIHCKVGWRVNNVEGKESGAQQHKVWKPRRLQPKRDEANEAYGQQETKFLDPGGFPFNLWRHVIRRSWMLSTLGVWCRSIGSLRSSSKYLFAPKGIDVSQEGAIVKFHVKQSLFLSKRR